MGIPPESYGALKKFHEFLGGVSAGELQELTDAKTGNPIVEDPRFNEWADHQYGCFYAHFDWVNEEADIVLIGITPGMRQARTALDEFRRCALTKTSLEESLAKAKQAASFDGQMRTIAAELMDRFRLNELFGLSTSAELFGSAANRTHYTSVLRNPVMQRKRPGEPWKDFSGGKDVLRHEAMRKMINDLFVPEIQRLSRAWLVPFGPTPATVLDDLGHRGLIDRSHILPGINHPSGTQRNRHNCQMKAAGESHADCALNVGCEKLQIKTRNLERIVTSYLGN